MLYTLTEYYIGRASEIDKEDVTLKFMYKKPYISLLTGLSGMMSFCTREAYFHGPLIVKSKVSVFL